MCVHMRVCARPRCASLSRWEGASVWASVQTPSLPPPALLWAIDPETPLCSLFVLSTFGELKTVRLPKKMAGTGTHRGFGFVDFLSKQDAKVSTGPCPAACRRSSLQMQTCYHPVRSVSLFLSLSLICTTSLKEKTLGLEFGGRDNSVTCSLPLSHTQGPGTRSREVDGFLRPPQVRQETAPSVMESPSPRVASTREGAEGVRGTVLQKETPRHPSGNPWGHDFPFILPAGGRRGSLSEPEGTDWVLTWPSRRRGGRGCGPGLLALSVVAALTAPGPNPQGRWR